MLTNPQICTFANIAFRLTYIKNRKNIYFFSFSPCNAHLKLCLLLDISATSMINTQCSLENIFHIFAKFFYPKFFICLQQIRLRSHHGPHLENNEQRQSKYRELMSTIDLKDVFKRNHCKQSSIMFFTDKVAKYVQLHFVYP